MWPVLQAVIYDDPDSYKPKEGEPSIDHRRWLMVQELIKYYPDEVNQNVCFNPLTQCISWEVTTPPPPLRWIGSMHNTPSSFHLATPLPLATTTRQTCMLFCSRRRPSCLLPATDACRCRHRRPAFLPPCCTCLFLQHVPLLTYFAARGEEPDIVREILEAGAYANGVRVAAAGWLARQNKRYVSHLSPRGR